MNKKYWLLTILAWLFCVGVPIAVTLSYFPLWVERGSSATISGTAVIFLMIAIIPLGRYAKQIFKSVYACIFVWAILLGLFIVLENIISEMVIVCEWALGSNFIASVLFVTAKKFKPKELIANGE